MKILILRTWLRNIGNGIIDKGCRAAIERAFPEAEIYETSGYPFVSADQKESGEFKELFQLLGSFGRKLESKIRKRKQYLDNMFNISDHISDIDLAVLPGCVLYEFALRPYMKIVDNLRRRDVPLLLLGVGGGDYEPESVKFVSNWLQDVSPAGLITRDSEAYSQYSEIVENAHNGIDCGFFINEWYTPPDSHRTFKAATFDKTKESEINGQLIVRPDHNPLGDSRPYESILLTLKNRIFRKSGFHKENALVSDMIEDYLYVYANAEETHSDRIHACVPALAYGNKARFYIDTPRDQLFDNILIEDIGKELVELSPGQIESKKQEQVQTIQEFI
jgi:hypothetical protein